MLWLELKSAMKNTSKISIDPKTEISQKRRAVTSLFKELSHICCKNCWEVAKDIFLTQQVIRTMIRHQMLHFSLDFCFLKILRRGVTTVQI